jgi:hypothetical protein
MMETPMLPKRLLTISLLLQLTAISTAAVHAGSTITDESYWPSEARQGTQNTAVSPYSDFGSAFAYDGFASNPQPAAMMDDYGSKPHYHGGPHPR